MNIPLLFDFVLSLIGRNKPAPSHLDYEKERESIEWYRGLNRVYFDIFEVVFSGYKSNEPFVVPDYWLNLSFVHLVNILKGAEQYTYIKRLPHFNYDDCVSLTINYEQMIKKYPIKRQMILDYRERIEQLFWLKNKGVEGNLPDYSEKDIIDYDELIQKHKEKRGLKQELQKSSTLQFYHHKSDKKSVYKILEKHKNEWVNKRTIEKEVGIKYDDFRAIIYQLRQDIISQNLNSLLRIENNERNGEYKLTVLA